MVSGIAPDLIFICQISIIYISQQIYHNSSNLIKNGCSDE
ncbi:hypothetical protein F385_2328 [Pantoea agglomerans 299R]|nr:hypothetical protein F385_2328 [Pantoea agglomerans 299R]